METGKARYVLKAGNNFIALDKSSGGYPYPVSDVDEAKIFDTRNDAIKYASVFVSSRGGALGHWPWTLHGVRTHVESGHAITNIEMGQYDEGA